MHNKAPAVTYPDDDSVISLKFGEKQVPAHDLRLVQRPKATQHFYVALRWDIGHCADSRRRKDAAAFCWGERDAAGATGRGPWRVGPKRTTSGAHWLRPSSPRGLWRGWTGFFFFFFFFYPDGLRRAAICLCAAGWCFLVAVRRAKLDVRAQNDSLHHWQQRLRCCSVLLVALFDAVSLSLSLSLSSVLFFLFPVGCGGGCASGPGEGEMLLEGQWGKAATAPSTDGQRKGVVCIRLFKVVPTAQHPHQADTRAETRAPCRGVTSEQGRDGWIHYSLQKGAAARPRWSSD